MTQVLILVANGQIARAATELCVKRADVQVTLYLRSAKRLWGPGLNLPLLNQVDVIEGDVLDMKTLKAAMVGQDVVYANLSGPLEKMAKNIVQAMKATGVKRLIFISSMGIYDEIFGERYGRVGDPQRKAATVIEASDLDYTILRPAWLNDKDEIAYETTQNGRLFKAADKPVSRKSVADLVVKLATTPGLEVRHSLGVNKAKQSASRCWINTSDRIFQMC
jgi:uncharacterized protein YbjT (DUF2867 family)